jgi:hypothetical protein
MKTDLFENVPRFAGAPPICLEENLPSFDSEKHIEEFRKKNALSSDIAKRWKCKFCGKLHYVTTVFEEKEIAE